MNLSILDSYSGALHDGMRAAFEGLPPELGQPSAYTLGAAGPDCHRITGTNGKLLRPTLTLLCAQAAGGRLPDAVPGAVAVQLAHDFSLVHDDIMNADSTRRERRSGSDPCGPGRAVLAGDLLHTLATRTLARVETPRAGAALRVLIDAVMALLRGQAADLAHERVTEISEERARQAATDRTAELIGAACRIGAVLAGVPPRGRRALAFHRYGVTLGMAVQLVDDIVGLWGRPASTGSPVWSGLARRRRSLPVVHALRAPHPAADELRRHGAALLREDSAAVAELVEQAGGREWAETEARHNVHDAVRIVDGLDAAEPYRAALKDVAWSVLEALSTRGGQPAHMPPTGTTVATETVIVPPEYRIAVVADRFPRRFHEHRWSLRTSTRQWMAAHGLLPDDVADAYTDNLLCYTDLVAGYYVGAPDPVLRAIAEFSAWFFVWDDQHGVLAAASHDQAWQALSTALRRALRRPGERNSAHDPPLVAAFADVVPRIRGDFSDDWAARFARHMAAVFDAYDQEYRNRRAGRVPDVDELLALRRDTFGHDVWIDLLESASGRELPAEIREHEAYRRAVAASQQFCSTYNDLCSLRKELAAGELHNLGISLMRHRGLGLEQATGAVRAHAVRRVERFLAAEARLTTLLDAGHWSTEIADTVRSCLANARNWISSTYWFHHESGRYRMREWADPARPPYVAGSES
ncbi:geranylgeranyl pyrophosphate synthase [Prauserella shujinwangii]|uniref:Geranylgeranyl pyrophosphate synthase n=1 Tax=Prauserella shujinwangii TaxID=1453103 RepID=A0A2T0LNV6_9PSEU|nr:polyprenyl synthetase family protein [Prauserella shujinwangii]PRX44932.1 geranylgeranyl pyrophosphate synthase [Prauserella shujinwangii]